MRSALARTSARLWLRRGRSLMQRPTLRQQTKALWNAQKPREWPKRRRRRRRLTVRSLHRRRLRGRSLRGACGRCTLAAIHSLARRRSLSHKRTLTQRKHSLAPPVCLRVKRQTDHSTRLGLARSRRRRRRRRRQGKCVRCQHNVAAASESPPTSGATVAQT